MLVDLDPGGLIDRARHFDRHLAVQEPGPEGDTVAEVVERAAATSRLLVPPGVRLLRFDLFGRNLHLVGEVEERPAIAAAIMDLDHVADRPFLDQTLGRVVAWRPGARPIDGEPAAAAGHRRHHPARVGDARGKRLLDQDMQAVRRDPFDGAGVIGGLRADDGQVGLRPCKAGLKVREHPIGGNREITDRRRHASRIGIEDAGNLRIGMLRHLTQQVAHMHVIEADADNPVFRHKRLPDYCTGMFSLKIRRGSMNFRVR
jgi:hypothetical protein